MCCSNLRLTLAPHRCWSRVEHRLLFVLMKSSSRRCIYCCSNAISNFWWAEHFPWGNSVRSRQRGGCIFSKSLGEVILPETAVERSSMLRNSNIDRKREVFSCAMHTLFDEYRFPPKYPDRELNIAGTHFESVIQHSLMSGAILLLPFRCVPDALQTLESAPSPVGR